MEKNSSNACLFHDRIAILDVAKWKQTQPSYYPTTKAARGRRREGTDDTANISGTDGFNNALDY